MNSQEAHDAAAQGVAKYLEWKQKFLADWGSAVQKGQLKSTFASLHPQLKEAMKSTDPLAYQNLVSKLGAGG